MSKPAFLVVGNWKMHGTRKGAIRLISEILAARQETSDGCQLAVCPPAVYIDAVAQQTAGRSVAVGAQDVAVPAAGAHTGDISAPMLADLGCRYCIVGHSERRADHAESSEQVAAKFASAREHGLVPILCVGETEGQRASGATERVIAEQIDAVLAAETVRGFEGAVVAYEPVWAIGTGQSATPEQAQTVHKAIRALIGKHDAAIASNLPILYGGSLKPANAAELFAMQDINGGLIGGASLSATDFLAICDAAGS
ncbi:MAG: triose-phosphate isomerase [Pseudomonadota bacterium]